MTSSRLNNLNTVCNFSLLIICVLLLVPINDKFYPKMANNPMKEIGDLIANFSFFLLVDKLLCKFVLI